MRWQTLAVIVLVSVALVLVFGGRRGEPPAGGEADAVAEAPPEVIETVVHQAVPPPEVAREAAIDQQQTEPEWTLAPPVRATPAPTAGPRRLGVYRELRSLELPAAVDPYLNDLGQVAYRSTDGVTLLEPDGTSQQVSLADGSIAVPLPDLDVWLVQGADAPTTLQARPLEGEPLWDSEVPQGTLLIGPSGQIIISGAEGLSALADDGTLLWQQPQQGTAISFSDQGEQLVITEEGWHLLDPEGKPMRSAQASDALGTPVLSRDGRWLLYPTGGILQGLEPQEPGWQGPGPLFAANLLNLYIFEKQMGPYSTLEARDGDGQPLWSRPVGPTGAAISLDGTLVCFYLNGFVEAVDGTNGMILGRLAGADAVKFSPNGKYLLVHLTDAWTLFGRE